MNSDIKIGVIVLLSIASGIGFVLLAAPNSNEYYQSDETLISKIFNSGKDQREKPYLDREFSIDLLDKNEETSVQPDMVKEISIPKTEALSLPIENKATVSNSPDTVVISHNKTNQPIENIKEMTDTTSLENSQNQSNKSIEKPLETKVLEDFTYTVKEGDNLSKIARVHYQDGSKHDLISRANNGVKSENLKIGMKLILPGEESQKKLAVNNKIVEKKTIVENSKPVIYKVKAGDTISSIAKKFYGKDYSMDDVKKANNGKDLSRLKIGESIYMPVQNKKK